MNKEIAMQWVAELRSGKHKQAPDMLQTKEGLCCLGVLCLIAPAEYVHFDDFGRIAGNDLDEQPEVKEWAGLSSGSGRFGPDPGCMLTQLNDGYWKDVKVEPIDFPQIADIIEANWEAL